MARQAQLLLRQVRSLQLVGPLQQVGLLQQVGRLQQVDPLQQVEPLQLAEPLQRVRDVEVLRRRPCCLQFRLSARGQGPEFELCPVADSLRIKLNFDRKFTINTVHMQIGACQKWKS